MFPSIVLSICMFVSFVGAQTSTSWIGTGTASVAGDGGTIGSTSISGQGTDLTYNTVSGYIYFNNWGYAYPNWGTPVVRYATSLTGTVNSYISNAASGTVTPTVNTQATNARLTSVQGLNFYVTSTSNVMLYIHARDSNYIHQSDLTSNYVSNLIGTGSGTNSFNTNTNINGPAMGATNNHRLYVAANTDIVRLALISPILQLVSSVSTSARNVAVYRGTGYFVRADLHAVYKLHLITGLFITWLGTATTSGMGTSPVAFTSPEGVDVDCARKILYIGHKSLYQVALTAPSQPITVTTTATYNYVHSARFVNALNRVFLVDYGGSYIYTVTTPSTGNTWASCAYTRTKTETSVQFKTDYGRVFAGIGTPSSSYTSSWDGTSVGPKKLRRMLPHRHCLQPLHRN
eukprot:PhF_6_TR38597/c0_g1_i2/m.57418